MLGQVSYTEALSGASHILSFQLPLKPSDLLRPHKISTQQFGAMWPAHAAERKTVVTTAAAAAAPKWPLLARGRGAAHVRRLAVYPRRAFEQVLDLGRRRDAYRDACLRQDNAVLLCRRDHGRIS